MGSIEAACISGFLCRLCSEMHRTVIHIYGDQGQKHGLAKKINDYLPVTITPGDPLPKTICETCMSRVEQHHDLMLKVARPRLLRANQNRVIAPTIVSEVAITNNTSVDSFNSSTSNRNPTAARTAAAADRTEQGDRIDQIDRDERNERRDRERAAAEVFGHICESDRSIGCEITTTATGNNL